VGFGEARLTKGVGLHGFTGATGGVRVAVRAGAAKDFSLTETDWRRDVLNRGIKPSDKTATPLLPMATSNRHDFSNFAVPFFDRI
jgi:hypothetical protein